MSTRSIDLKRRLGAGEVTFGAWLTVASGPVAEIMAWAGFDWVLIDMEHGPFSLEGLQSALIAFNGAPTVPIVRIPWNDPVHIKQVLDIGADGLVIPMINTVAEARAAISACKYPPEGTRGFGPRRAAAYGRLTEEYVAGANAGVVVVLQVEHVDAVANLDGILSVPGIDVVCLGPADLSGSAGLLRQFEHPSVLAAIEETIAKCSARRIPVAMGPVYAEERMRSLVAKGVTMVITGEDSAFLRNAAGAALARGRGLKGPAAR